MDLKQYEYLTHAEVIKLLRVDGRVLKETMNRTPDAFVRPWIRYGGTDRRPRYRWKADQIHDWWQAVNHIRFGDYSSTPLGAQHK